MAQTLPMQSSGFTPKDSGSGEPGSQGPKSHEDCNTGFTPFSHKPKAPAGVDHSSLSDRGTGACELELLKQLQYEGSLPWLLEGAGDAS